MNLAAGGETEALGYTSYLHTGGFLPGPCGGLGRKNCRRGRCEICLCLHRMASRALPYLWQWLGPTLKTGIR